MTDIQKGLIDKLRSQGYGYGRIAAELSMSKNTVKSYCQRNKIAEYAPCSALCKQCGAPIRSRKRYRPREFCSDKCRVTWWRNHNSRTYEKSVYRLICRHCGTAFESIGNRKRKYCSHGCYISDRFGKEGCSNE